MDATAPAGSIPLPLPARSPLFAAIVAARRRPEPECVAPLLAGAELPEAEARAAAELARRLVAGLRGRQMGVSRENLVQVLLQEFSLSSEEGVALMCLAEALLRIPDDATRDALIRDKIGRGDWGAHLGQSDSAFVNAATWGLLVTGRLVATHDAEGLAAGLTRVTARFGEPLIRKAVDLAMRLMGKQFVCGETIAEALENARRFESQGFRYSYDMLGEAAMTREDAERFHAAYTRAIAAIGDAAPGRGVREGPGISMKLSALHPRYALAKRSRVHAELYPRLRDLVVAARRRDVGVSIDAEESDRLELSLELLERLCGEAALAGWDGVGFVVQAYLKRCPETIDWAVDLARRTHRRLMVRLVKGAYWDAEVKRAQVDGLEGYPVYTRKVHSDVAYLACAAKLLGAPEAVYPQFATHNAQTLASVFHMAGEYAPGRYEFQCLHGMGEPLYEQVVGPAASGGLGVPCRIYAPVGTHETLLAYLVRRLLENGANTSFINRIADPKVSLDELVASPVDTVRRAAAAEGATGLPHRRIPLPRRLFGEARANSLGADLADEATLARLAAAFADSRATRWSAEPTTGAGEAGEALAVVNPADPADRVGTVREADAAAIEASLAAAAAAAPRWQAVLPSDRAAMLERGADLLESRMAPVCALVVREAGKTWSNAVAEVREAVDFLRYYAREARGFANATHRALGPVACISPWNFPLAIFAGQAGAALAAGNPVLAKPAEQTPLVAAEMVRFLHEAGVPREALQLVPGRGETVGAALVADPRVQGVVFTGSTEVARLIQRTLASRLGPGGRPVPLVAETGGQNAMIVDSSALAEQVVADALASAFDSAGQRCSALRVLCVQEDVADRVLAMLRGALAELAVGDPAALAVDVGPVIDASARAGILAHVEAMRARGRPVHAAGTPPAKGTFVAPTLVEIASLAELTREVFGPVLHVLRWKREERERLLGDLHALGYGLTLGIHSRVDGHIESIAGRARVGNVYVNRNMIGAVVGVQPFGGEGLSGTGPKAGGPLYLHRLLSECPPAAAIEALRALDAEGLAASLAAHAPSLAAFAALREWAAGNDARLAAFCARFAALSPAGAVVSLPGPTGERNTYAAIPRRAILCLATDERDLLSEIAATLALGSRAVVPASGAANALVPRLPDRAREAVAVVADWMAPEVAFDLALHHGGAEERLAALARLAARPGPVVSLHGFAPGAEDLSPGALVAERVVSVNTAAAGGNASLMTVG